MTNAAGLRNHRAQLFSRSNVGKDGFVFPAYTMLYERWCRIDTSSATVRMMGQKLNLVIDAVADFSDEVTVPAAGIIKNVGSGNYFWIRGIEHHRQTRRYSVGLQRLSAGEINALVGSYTLTKYDGVNVPNGSMTSGSLVIDAGEAFVMVLNTPKGGGTFSTTYTGSILIEGVSPVWRFLTIGLPDGSSTLATGPLTLTWNGHVYTFALNA